ncbi:MAG: amidophosphoribosyltransferase [Saprospiraceae bacterium]|nr:MAG: amidophosphoribosyltransferase [Saprospiraceae bacterium]
MKSQLRFLYDFFALFYPNLCLACDANLPPNQESLCLPCQYHLPKTNYHLLQENPFSERFWGRLPLQSAAAFYKFNKGGRTQHLIHRLKYENKQAIGIRLGQLYGSKLRESPFFAGIDLIIPVPLHPKRLRERGYNQSELFARGLAESMDIPTISNGLQRQLHTTTQTHKSRLERVRNVAEAFMVNSKKMLEGKHILLVDDVVTTGATLEACGNKLLEVAGTRLSLATIAIADY